MELCLAMTDSVVEERLIAECREGDREAFRRLYDAYQSQVYSTALYFMNGCAASAEDVTQDVFVKLFSRIRQFRNEAAFSTWLHRMVVNTCMDELRKRKRVETNGEIADSEDTVDFDLPLTQAEVQKAVSGLSPKLRAPILMKYFQDLSYDEMAKALNCSMGTVASRLSRGHRALAQNLAHLRDSAGLDG